jgi:hypothetical protein
MKHNMKSGGGLFNAVKGAAGAAAGAAGVKVPSVSELAKKVTDAVMGPGTPLAEAAAVATSLPGKLTDVIETVEDAPKVIAEAAADKATEAIDARLAEVQLPAANGSGNGYVNNSGNNYYNNSGNNYENNSGNNYSNNSGNNYYNNSGNNYENTGEEDYNSGNNYENTGEEDYNSGNNYENTGEEEEYANNQEGGRYETIHLKKPLKDPLHVFYLDGKPIYYTDNGKGRVKILPIHMNMKMAKTSSRHKYTKKMRHKRKTRSTKKSRAKGVRKTSRKAKQRRTRRH